VLRCAARGWNNKAIAGQLHVQEQTVKNVLQQIYVRLQLHDHTQLALYYWGIWQQLA
jgi:DNA-binding NarL/FixJ family response regulator